MNYWMIDDKYEHMPWDEIDAVVFDVGNVLIRFDPQALLEELVPDAPEMHGRLMTRVFRSPYWCMRDHGIITTEDAIEAMTGRDQAIAPYVRRIMTEWIDLKVTIPEGIEAIRTCKAHGKKVYVLSNYADEPFAFADAKFDFFRLFDGKIISGRVKLEKPEPAIYSCLTHTFDLRPHRTMFIDDSYANIESALAMGWQALLYDRPGKLRDFLGENC